MRFKKICAFAMAMLMMVLLASCGGNPSGTETTDPSTVGTETPEETQDTAGTEPPDTGETGSGTDTTESEPQETTGSPGGEDTPRPDTGLGIEYLEIGDYVTLVYNAGTCEVEYEVERGLGSRQTVTLTAQMKDGFLFDGWTVGNALVNERYNGHRKPITGRSDELTYSFEVSSDTMVYLNSSMTLVYHANGGILSSGASDRETYSLVFYHNPNTRPEDGSFVRDGYTLVGYNTKADGTGETVSLGGRIQAFGAASLDLYCMWEENTPETDFTYETSSGTAAITGYTGASETVVIPQSLGGYPVTRIEEGAFSGSGMKKVVIAQTVSTVAGGAFARCENLETVVLFDASFEASYEWAGSSYGISDESFTDCDNLKDIRINTVYALTNTWQSYSAGNLDRLMWAANKKKVIIIGGSGAHYGFESGILDEALGGEYEIINFGENANITSLLYFDLVEDFIQEGDIVLWTPEPGELTLGSTSCGYRFWDFRKSDYDFLKYLDLSLYSDLLSSFSNYCATLPTSNFTSFDAQLQSVNQYGDDVSTRVWNGQRHSYYFNYSLEAEDALASLVSSITEKGGSVYFSFAAMQRSGMANVQEAKVLAFEEMIESVPGIISISDYQDCIYDDDCFYDSAWHMTNEGARERTEQVAKDILAQLAKEGK